MKSSTQLGKYSKSEIAVGGSTEFATIAPIPKVDPVLKQEINEFLQWINDSNGLAANIQYYLDLNDPTIIAKIAQAYNGFRKVFGF